MTKSGKSIAKKVRWGLQVRFIEFFVWSNFSKLSILAQFRRKLQNENPLVSVQKRQVRHP